MIAASTNLLKSQQLPVHALLQRLWDSGTYRSFSFLSDTLEHWEEQTPPALLWKRALRLENCWTAEELRLLTEYGHILGAGTLEEQLAALEALRREWELLIMQAAEKRDREGKLYRSMGILSGILLSILMF